MPLSVETSPRQRQAPSSRACRSIARSVAMAQGIPFAEALPLIINNTRVNTRALARTHSVQFTRAFACRTINIRAPSRTRALPHAPTTNISHLPLVTVSHREAVFSFVALRRPHPDECRISPARGPSGFHPRDNADFSRGCASDFSFPLSRAPSRTPAPAPPRALSRLCVHIIPP